MANLSLGEWLRVSPNSEGQDVTILRDSRSFQSCMLSSSLSECFEDVDEYVLLEGFPNTVTSWPLKSVFLQSKYFTGWCKLAVVDSFLVSGIDLVLGETIWVWDEWVPPMIQ